MHKVTVILTSFNHGKYIREAIESTLNQTFTDFELIILDDCSSDDSWKTISQYTDPRIRAFRNAVNMGGSVEINRVISEADPGVYIAMHHSDDVWETDKLEKEVAFLDAHPEIGAVFSNALAIGEDSAPLTDKQHFYSDVFNQPNRSRHEWLRHFFFHGNALCHPSVLIRKTCYESCGSYPYGLAQLGDFDMWIRLCLRYEIHVLSEPLVRFRVRDNEANTSGNRPEVRIRHRSEAHHIFKHFFKITGFQELASIFPEINQYYRDHGCEPRFVMSMVALSENSSPWARSLGIETLYDLFSDVSTKERLQSLYQFGVRELISLTGKHDLYYQELLASQSSALAEREAVMFGQQKIISQLNRSLQAASMARMRQPITHHISVRAATEEREIPADRRAYKKVAQMGGYGQSKESKPLLESLADLGSSCWEVYNDLAVLCFNEGEYLRAVPYFRKGIELEGKAGTTARNFASMLLVKGDVDEALSVLGEILHDQPHDAAVLASVCDILSNTNPIHQDTWNRLVSDLRCEQRANPTEAIEEIMAYPHLEREVQCGHDASEKSSDKAISANARDVIIFQIYYDELTKSKLDPSFIPLDNTENLRPDWCEYWPIRNVLLNQTFDEDAYIGFFSPRFFEKTGIEGNEVLEKSRCANEEIVNFSPFLDQSAIYANPFVQGEIYHPGFIETTHRVLSLLKVNLELDSLICDQTTTIFSNYFVARYSFWKKWLFYAEKIFEVCEGPNCELKTSLERVTTYRNEDYAVKVFILERLVTIVMEELAIKSKVAIDVQKARFISSRSKDNLIPLLICDALKGQYKRTGLPAYKDAYFLFLSPLMRSIQGDSMV